MKQILYLTMVLLFNVSPVSLGEAPRALGRVPVGGRFKDLGVPVQSLTVAMGQVVAPRTGENQKVYTACYDPNGAVFVLEVDPDTGATKTYPCPAEEDHEVYGITLGLDNKQTRLFTWWTLAPTRRASWASIRVCKQAGPSSATTSASAPAPTS